MRHTYTYLFCDLRTDVVLAELPLAGVQYSYVLNGVGTLRGTIPYSAETLPLDPENASTPGRTALYVDRDGVIVWGGVVWTRELADGGKSIQAAEFLSYYQHRYVKTTLSTDTSLITNTAYVGNPGGQRLYVDQKHIAWSLLRYAHSQEGGTFGLDINQLAGAATGVARSQSYFGYERPEIYKSLAELANAADGFDFGVEVGWTAPGAGQIPQRYRRAQVYFPRRGRAADQSGLLFSKGRGYGSILSYTWPEDGATFATEMSGLGAGSGEARIVKTASASDLISSGWPLLEAVETYDGVIDEAQVQSLTDADLTARSQAQTMPSFEVSADTDPEFGSYTVGDEARFVIDPEPLSPAGRDITLRIVGIEATPSSGPERVRLTCAGV
ncbi:hypothetical protein ACIP6Q_39035 [Streptomyces bobili]|uniref:hypothetical protein n=1 Tax=Streptomyces bobili TaxID=67280 RepID=UPI003826B532